MKFVKLQTVLKSDTAQQIPTSGYIAFKTKTSFLIGPSISKHFCPNCFKKRLFSSEFIEEYQYTELSPSDEKRIRSKLESHKVGSLEIFEFRYRKKMCMHHLIPIPGCTHSAHQTKHV